MKRIWLITLLLLMVGVGSAWAAENEGDGTSISERTAAILTERDSKLPRVAILYTNNAKTEYDTDIDAKIMSHLKKLAVNRWVLVPGEIYKDRLAAKGIRNVSMAERTDILAVGQEGDADVLLLIEVEPFSVQDRVEFLAVTKAVTTSIPVKAVDRNTGTYLYNGKFNETSRDAEFLGGPGFKTVLLKSLDLFFSKFDYAIPPALSNVKHREAQ
ncbi:hypothetical protein [Anaeromusa acidaminophila]|uniref:hypothetical protein n=1 Tax=Anaeromusa acidaminophila TaxID=81464 RepID=UPI00037539E5|nr:hypothetical protein [Anaeromusa acidaminophila]